MKPPFAVRARYHQLRRHVEWRRHPLPWASTRVNDETLESENYHFVATRTSPLQRAPTGEIAAHTAEKTRNLQLATARINRVLLKPGEVFSFCRLVGPTTKRRGYLPALEMHDGQLQPETGGGLCQLANLLLLLAIDINAKIIERHRHSLDLFRDVERTVPFGCGATVFYNYVDFQFQNTLPFPVVLRASVEAPLLRAQVLAPQTLPFQTKIAETDHRFFRRDGEIYRANKLWKEIEYSDGRAPQRELLSTNECKVLYPADDLINEDAS